MEMKDRVLIQYPTASCASSAASAVKVNKDKSTLLFSGP
jgi:hypothetical protein